MGKVKTLLLLICALGLSYASFLPLSKKEPNELPSPVTVESYVAGDFDQLQIHKIYRLSPTESPNFIPIEDFEENGRTYRFLKMCKEESDGGLEYIIVFGCTDTPYHNSGNF